MFLAVGLYIASLSIKAIMPTPLGPEFMPQVVALVFFVVGCIILVGGIKHLKTYTEDGTEAESYKLSLINLGLTGGLMALYVSFLQSIGFVPMTFIYIVGQVYLVTPTSDYTKKMLIRVLTIAVISSITLYYLFYYVFQVFLPQGIWF